VFLITVKFVHSFPGCKEIETVSIRAYSILYYLFTFLLAEQGVTKRCRLTWLTNSALVYDPKCGGGGSCGDTAYTGAQINFGDLTPYLTLCCRVIAVGSGEGDLLAVSLELPDDCHDKHVEPLAIAPVYVHVNLDTAKRERNNNNNVFKVNNNNNNSKSANNSGKRNRKKGEQQQQQHQHRRQQHGMDSIGSNSNNNHGMSSMKSVDMGDLSEILSNIALRDDNSRDNADRGPPYRPPAANNPGGQPSYYGGSASGGSNGFSLHPHETATTLEVGMYILLGVFCVAIAVFMASCFVYASKQNNSRFLPSAAHHHPGLVMMQQQHHHSNHHKSRSVQNAHDWVWLGRQSTTLDGSKLSGCPSLATSGSRDDGLLAAGETATAASSSLLSREFNRRDRPPGGGYYLRDPTSRPPHFGGFVNGRWVGGGERNYNNDVNITVNPGEMYADERLGGDFEYERRHKDVASGAGHDFYAELPRHHHHNNSNGNHHRRSPRAHRREQRRRQQQQQDNGSIHSGGHNNNRSVESMLLLQQQQQYQQQQQDQQQHQLLSRSTFMAAVQKSPESSQQQQQQQQRQPPQLKQARASSSPSSSSPSSPSVRHWGNQNIPLGNRVINNNNNNNNNEEEEEVTSPNSSVQGRPSINSATYTRQKPVLAGAGAILPVGYPIFSVRGGSTAAAAPLGSSGGFQNPWEALHHRGNGRSSYFPREKQTADRHFFQVKNSLNTISTYY
jgi:hypothetical protein